MNQFRVTMVDVNDAPFYVFIEAEFPEDAFYSAEFENKYCRSVQVEEYVFEGSDYDIGDWVVVFVPEDDDGEYGDGMTDVEADADTLRNCGWGTDEDYCYYEEEYV